MATRYSVFEPIPNQDFKTKQLLFLNKSHSPDSYMDYDSEIKGLKSDTKQIKRVNHLHLGISRNMQKSN